MIIFAVVVANETVYLYKNSFFFFFLCGCNMNLNSTLLKKSAYAG